MKGGGYQFDCIFFVCYFRLFDLFYLKAGAFNGNVIHEKITYVLNLHYWTTFEVAKKNRILNKGRHSAQACDFKRDKLWVRFPLKEMKCTIFACAHKFFLALVTIQSAELISVTL